MGREVWTVPEKMKPFPGLEGWPRRRQTGGGGGRSRAGRQDGAAARRPRVSEDPRLGRGQQAGREGAAPATPHLVGSLCVHTGRKIDRPARTTAN